MLYRIPKGEIAQSEYVTLPDFAFEAFDHLFFTSRATAVRLSAGADVVEISPEI